MKLFLFIWNLLSGREKKRARWLAASDLLVSVLDIFSFAALVWMIGFYTSTDHPTAIQSFFPANWNHSAWPLLLIFLFFAIKNFLAWVHTRRKFIFLFGVAGRLSSGTALEFLEGSYETYIHKDSSEHQRKIGQQPIEFAQYELGGLFQLLNEAALVSMALVAIAWYNFSLLLLLTLALLPGIAVTGWLLKKRIHGLRAQAKESSEKSLRALRELLDGFVESNVYGKNRVYTGRYAAEQEKLNNYLAGLQTTQALPSRIIEIFSVAGLCLVIFAQLISGNLLFNGGWLHIGAFAAAAWKIIPGIVRISNTLALMRTYAFSVNDLPQPGNKNQENKGAGISYLRSIAFEDVSFHYPQKEVIDHLSFTLEPGDFAAISGFSGRGKTTVLNLLLGFLKPQSGQISINGQNIDQFGKDKLLERIAYVRQQSHLWHDTIRENITMGEPYADASRLEEVISGTGLDPFMRDEKSDAESIIAEQGKNISGGQRQRLAIARALYKNADLVILDEPFNELDRISEMALLDHFKKLAGEGKMIIFVSHREESFAWCNKVIRLHE